MQRNSEPISFSFTINTEYFHVLLSEVRRNVMTNEMVLVLQQNRVMIPFLGSAPRIINQDVIFSSFLCP